MLDVCGPIARTATDIDLLWTALISGAQPAPARPIRLGLVDPETWGDVADSVSTPVMSAAHKLAKAAGGDLVTASALGFGRWHLHRRIPLLAGIADAHGALPSGNPWLQAVIEHGRRITRAQMSEALHHITVLADALTHTVRRFDAVLLPTTPIAAPLTADAVADAEADQPHVDRILTALCAPLNFCPLAALTVPCGLSADGLPAGLQIVANDEATAIAIALMAEHLGITDLP